MKNYSKTGISDFLQDRFYSLTFYFNYVKFIIIKKSFNCASLAHTSKFTILWGGVLTIRKNNNVTCWNRHWRRRQPLNRDRPTGNDERRWLPRNVLHCPLPVNKKWSMLEFHSFSNDFKRDECECLRTIIFHRSSNEFFNFFIIKILYLHTW